MSTTSKDVGLQAGVQARRADAGDSKQQLDQEASKQEQRYSPNDFCRPEMHCSKELQQFIESMQQQKKKIKLKSNLILGETRISNVDIEDCGIILRHAALLGKIEIILEILNHKEANKFMNSKDEKTGYTALMLAAAKGHLNCVVLLLDLCASPHVYCNKKNDATHYATVQHHQEIADIISGREIFGKQLYRLLNSILDFDMDTIIPEKDIAKICYKTSREYLTMLQDDLNKSITLGYPLLVYCETVCKDKDTQKERRFTLAFDSLHFFVTALSDKPVLSNPSDIPKIKTEQYRMEALKILLSHYRKHELINHVSQLVKRTPLQEATQNGHQGLVDTLLDHGADPVMENLNSYGSYPIEEIRKATLKSAKTDREKARINKEFDTKAKALNERLEKINALLTTRAHLVVFMGFKDAFGEYSPLPNDLIQIVANYVFTPFLPSGALGSPPEQLTSAAGAVATASAASTSALGAPRDDDGDNDPSTKPAVPW